jgi:glyceraldehyde 3-phosphate dehydrogenase
MDNFGAENFLSASMVTVHAATGSQQVLDRLPAAGATDLRKSRSILNNIILTTTGAAKALGLVIPEMKNIGFIAESVRIPTSTGSLIVLVLNLQDDLESPDYSEEQNVSCDIVCIPCAATVIEGTETHTRTATVNVNLDKIKSCNIEPGTSPKIQVPVTQAVIYGWYDNELGSYTNMLGDLTVSITDKMV